MFGVKFTPGGFHPFLRTPVAALANRRVALSTLFGDAGIDVARAMRAASDDGARIAIVERFLRERGARPDANVTRVSGIVYDIAADRELLKVSDLSRRFAINKRTLERLFARYDSDMPTSRTSSTTSSRPSDVHLVRTRRLPRAEGSAGQLARLVKRCWQRPAV